MNAQEMQEIAKRLRTALDSAGILVERADVLGGNIKAWERVPEEGIVGRWLQAGWRVSLDHQV